MNKRTGLFFLLIAACFVCTIQAQEVSQPVDTAVKDAQTLTQADQKAGDKPLTATDSLTAVKDTRTLVNPDKESIINVPSLNDEVAAKLAKILKEIEGIKSLKPDMENKKIHLVYSGKLNFENDILKKIHEIDAQSRLEATKDIPAHAGDKCGGCPNKSKCKSGDTGTTVKESEKKVEGTEASKGC